MLKSCASEPASAYDEAFFEARQSGALSSAAVVVPELVRLVHPRRVVDVGCGRGAWLKVFRDHGVDDVLGIDGEYVARTDLLIPEDCFRALDMARSWNVDGRFDLALCLEVAEHLPARCAGALVAQLTALAPVVVFSAALPGQGGTRHINEQWPEYWKRLFARHGFECADAIRPLIWRDQAVDWWYRQNALIYVSRASLPDHPHLAEHRVDQHDDRLELIHPDILRQYTSFRGLLSQLPRALWRAVRHRSPV